MNLKLQRGKSTDKSTPGSLSVDAAPECFTLEDVVRPGDIFQVKVAGETAIPAGTYEVYMEFSPHFGKIMPHLRDVPNFTHIMIHPLNDAKQSHGCIGVGLTQAPDYIGNSVKAFQILVAKIQHAITGGDRVLITILDAKPDLVEDAIA